MYMELKVADRVFRIEYSIEASLYGECTKKVIEMLGGLSMSEDDSAGAKIEQIANYIGNLPKTTLTMLYAGLMEHHGEDGDKTVMSMKDAKSILATYLKENKGSEDYYSLLTKLFVQMGEDGFFELIGVDKIMEQTEETKE